MSSGQLILVAGCHVHACGRPVVGHSITGDGHVCREHNEMEWRRALTRTINPVWVRALGELLPATAPPASTEEARDA